MPSETSLYYLQDDLYAIMINSSLASVRIVLRIEPLWLLVLHEPGVENSHTLKPCSACCQLR